MKTCEKNHDDKIKNNQASCQAIEPLDGCIKDVATKRCGADGWPIYHQLIEMNLAGQFPACRRKEAN